MKVRRRKISDAFTLAELLIALAILGVIATFTIPKVLTAQQDGRKKAVFRETLATLSSVTYQGVQDGGLSNPTLAAEFNYFTDHINHTKKCTNAITEGCSAVGDNVRGFLMHNGAFVGDFDNIATDASGGRMEAVVIDWNGPEGPNVDGDDILAIEVYFGTGPYGTRRLGTINVGATPAHIALHQWIFSN